MNHFHLTLGKDHDFSTLPCFHPLRKTICINLSTSNMCRSLPMYMKILFSNIYQENLWGDGNVQFCPSLFMGINQTFKCYFRKCPGRTSHFLGNLSNAHYLPSSRNIVIYNVDLQSYIQHIWKIVCNNPYLYILHVFLCWFSSFIMWSIILWRSPPTTYQP